MMDQSFFFLFLKKKDKWKEQKLYQFYDLMYS